MEISFSANTMEKMELPWRIFVPNGCYEKYYLRMLYIFVVFYVPLHFEISHKFIKIRSTLVTNNLLFLNF